MRQRMRSMLGTGLVCLALTAGGAGTPVRAAGELVPDVFMDLLLGPSAERPALLERIAAAWEPSFVPMMLETIYLGRDPTLAAAMLEVLERKTGQDLAFDIGAWQRWLWNRPPATHPRYLEFKAALYRLVDERFAPYFAGRAEGLIRSDEIVWGGVRQDGIPPLREPAMVAVAAASYLADDNIVFGLEVGGDARAYPKRILAWHEMFVDTVGGVPVAGVYCTLCGAMILYRTTHDGVVHRLGTSGFLYRSNKLMYDQETQSLWSTMRGVPVLGPLAGRDIRLERLSVVTTTWGEWRRRHPDTRVLSLDTGYQRNYDEGEAYRAYFATDELMFAVPGLDSRLANKAEVLGLLFAQYPDRPLAVAADYLVAHPVYTGAVGELAFVVLTDASGANRVFESAGVRIASWDRAASAVDAGGGRWQVTEGALLGPGGRRLNRLPAHRSFWFGWFSAFPRTRLVH